MFYTAKEDLYKAACYAFYGTVDELEESELKSRPGVFYVYHSETGEVFAAYTFTADGFEGAVQHTPEAEELIY